MPTRTKRDLTVDQIFDVYPAMPQRTAVLVGLGDLGGEGYDALKSLDEVFRYSSHAPILAPGFAATPTVGTSRRNRRRVRCRVATRDDEHLAECVSSTDPSRRTAAVT